VGENAVAQQVVDAAFRVHNLVDNVPLLVHTGLLEREEQNPDVPVRFYRTDAGRSPVLDWLRRLDKDDRHAIGLDLMRVQFGWPSGGHWWEASRMVFGRCARHLRASG
jgi:hypothetical protein